ncbi:MAG: NADPH2:quinone reductase [Methylophagaceae bacterium]|jgi:NADPH2:quinone reductase
MSEKMKAIGYQMNNAAPTSFERDLPIAKGHDLLVKISAIAVNPVDTKVKESITTWLQTPRILGWDAVGIVMAAGEKTVLLDIGDKVFYAGDISRPGCYASHQLVDERLTAKAPLILKPEQSAAMPLASITAWESLFSRLKIFPQYDDGKTILIIGGAGGVGSIAIQLAKVVAKLNVVTTASRPETEQWCKRLGADHVLDHSEELISQYRMLNIDKPDYILCCADTDQYFDAMAALIAPEGMICALVSSQKDYNMNALKTKSAGFIWEFMFTRPMFNTKNITAHHNILNNIAELLDEGKIISTLKETLGPITPENITKAHRQLLTNKTIGKIALTSM